MSSEVTIGVWTTQYTTEAGRPTDAPIDRSEHELADWELLMDAIVGALGANR